MVTAVSQVITVLIVALVSLAAAWIGGSSAKNAAIAAADLTAIAHLKAVAQQLEEDRKRRAEYSCAITG